MKRAILLQTSATTSKNSTLKEALTVAVDTANFMLSEVPKFARFNDFHKSIYSASKTNTSFNSQIICEIERQMWRKPTQHINRITLKFNVPRNCKTFSKSMPFIRLSLYSKHPVSVPIVKNRSFQRYSDLLKNGWTCKTYGLTSNLEIVAYLSNDEVPLTPKKAVLGIDINAKHFAVSIVSDKGNMLYQTYFGRQIYARRRHIMERRSMLQSFNNTEKLDILKTKEYDFVETNIGQMIKKIIGIAKRFDSDIAIENLKRFKGKGRKFNKTVMRIPFFKFRQILSSRCFDNGITLDIVDAWHTSKFCNHCGAVGKGHDSSNYALFRCKECGVIVNSDRNASINIAMKSLLERKDSINNKTFQISNRKVPVNGLVRPDAVVEPIVAVRHVSSTYGKPTTFSRG